MLHYRCEKCGQKYTGWANKQICGKCGGQLKEISREEFELDEEDKEELKSDHKIRN